MAEDFWQRRRRREESERREAEDQADEITRKGHATAKVAQDLTKRFDEMVRRVPGMIDQLNHLYHHFMVGLLFRPPLEERSRLDQLIVVLSNIQKGTPADRFRFNTLQTSYQVNKQRWDKIVQDVESGKIERITGPAKAGHSRR